MSKRQIDRTQALLDSVSADMLDFDPQQFADNSIRVERILLELVRPDPVQPRRVLPERIHTAFHHNRLTPTQALRELVQLVQVAARQRGRPFSNVLELLPNPESENDDDGEAKLSPEEILLRDLVNLAVTINDDGQVNPITVVDVSEGVTRLYRIETGERRYWATWLLRDFIPGYTGDGMIPCIIVPTQKTSVFRQAKENTSRTGLTAIAMARQSALLLLAVHGYEIPAYAVTNDFYRQAKNLRLPREYAQLVYSAMGVKKGYFSYFKNLLDLSDEAMELADRYDLEEGLLRYVLKLPTEDQAEMVQQIIQFNLTGRQVQVIVEGEVSPEKPVEDEIPPHIVKLGRLIMRDLDKKDAANLAQVIYREKRDVHMTRAYLQRLAELALAAAELASDS
ncbi:MAG: ParB N-terminal domain-containing protein [Chloroflexi bacterium]|nr:ParB N-terminal domain-containing protein [Chloroflexota bacterium]